MDFLVLLSNLTNAAQERLIAGLAPIVGPMMYNTPVPTPGGGFQNIDPNNNVFKNISVWMTSNLFILLGSAAGIAAGVAAFRYWSGSLTDNDREKAKAWSAVWGFLVAAGLLIFGGPIMTTIMGGMGSPPPAP